MVSHFIEISKLTKLLHLSRSDNEHKFHHISNKHNAIIEWHLLFEDYNHGHSQFVIDGLEYIQKYAYHFKNRPRNESILIYQSSKIVFGNYRTAFLYSICVLLPLKRFGLPKYKLMKKKIFFFRISDKDPLHVLGTNVKKSDFLKIVHVNFFKNYYEIEGIIRYPVLI